MITSKALEKLLCEWDGGAPMAWARMTGLELCERAHAIGLREGRKSRGKVVARGWVFPEDFDCSCAVVGVVRVDRRQIRVEVVAKEVKRGAKK